VCASTPPSDRCLRPQLTFVQIENEFDPHPQTAANPFARHNPWSVADDPDEADIDEFSRAPGTSWRDSRDARDRLGNGRGGRPAAQTGDPIFGQFASMIQGMTGNQRNPNFYPSQPQQPYGLFPAIRTTATARTETRTISVRDARGSRFPKF